MKLLTGSDSIKMPKMSLFGKPSRRQLIQRESEIGGKLFGPVPLGHHRQFFNLDQHTWVWYEEWTDEQGVPQSTTTRYEMHENGILKVQEGTPYYFIDGQELVNLVSAMGAYYERVMREIYRRDPTTGSPLAA
jgi:hypothetical protein